MFITHCNAAVSRYTCLLTPYVTDVTPHVDKQQKINKHMTSLKHICNHIKCLHRRGLINYE